MPSKEWNDDDQFNPSRCPRIQMIIIFQAVKIIDFKQTLIVAIINVKNIFGTIFFESNLILQAE